jgi:hypothetical protein
MKSTTFLFITALLFDISTSTLQSIDYRSEQQDDFLITCCTPLDFSQPRTVPYFLQNIMSNKRYTQDYLPYNLSSHLMQFLDHGKASKQKAVFVESTIRLFYNCLKRSPFVCNKAFSEMLDQIPLKIKSYCSACFDGSYFSQVEKNMMSIFVPTFLTQFSFFKTNPEDFLKNLSHEVAVMIENSFNAQDHVTEEQLKQMFVRFLELNVLKLLWDPADQEGAWNSVKTISVQLADVMEIGLITPDELDDLYKSVIESFCRFLDLAGSEFPLTLVDAMKEDVYSDDLLMFELEEQEQFIETKRERMIDALLEVEAKIEARMCGIITDVVVY